MRRKILLPTDFSKNAWHAINYAIELYKKDHCDFYILNVFSSNGNILDNLLSSSNPGTKAYETGKLESENGLAKTLDMLAFKDYDNPKHHFETISKYSNTVDTIKDLVNEKDIEMIVMGTKGATGSDAVVYGSTAINVMEKIRTCPVIVVPESAKHSLPKEIVFPTGYRTSVKRRELEHLIDMAKKCSASIKILHVVEEQELNEDQLNNKSLLEEYFKNIDHSFHQLSRNEIPVAINCFVESRDSDMVAFINKKHGFFGSILTNPLVKQMGRTSKVPLLAMHDLTN